MSLTTYIFSTNSPHSQRRSMYLLVERSDGPVLFGKMKKINLEKSKRLFNVKDSNRRFHLEE
jgi:hypothetical protein